ncbi:MAG: UDP-N-acetylmuramoylalanyl-D-glutamyl-2, 6-diaminopimelate--D-alanyl-D-alanine ligase [Candidatus Omnitrophica bacterium CG11_big_fil_rev_8_21_14_0_20_43_6]|nr:MAG: UDP-N-acetylmuramoylalanyl-D-glutamyl-2, 6-diaminopimelate--D-alanyl-D-alanine ligase [Candidatus Omnitrophica bacterium CG11_big_fil_rev_8_21_14_0_20_43_6]
MFKVDDIIRATRGLLVQGNASGRIAGISTDSRSLKPKEAFLALRGKNFDGHNFIRQAIKSGVSCIVVESKPEIPIPAQLSVIKVKDTTLALGDIGRFQRQKINLPVIAVTGSNGKTTTKEMVAWVLSAHAKVLKNEGTKNNQIGLPQTLIQLTKQDKFAVVEIGTNHFGEVDYLAKIARPNIGIITNIGPSHLEFLKDLKGVFKEKTSLLDNLASPAIALLNADDPALKILLEGKTKGCRIFSYGINTKSDFSASSIKLENGKVEFKVNAKFNFELSSLGNYNVYNALAAIAAGRILGLNYAGMRARLAGFKFPKGRLNLAEYKGLKFIDDTYNSNPLSLKVALDVLAASRCPGRKILIMGDMLELGQQKELLHRQIAWSITNTCDLLIAVGKLARITASAARRYWKADRIFCCDNARQAWDLLFKQVNAGAGDLILVKGSRSMKMEGVLRG